MPLLRPAVLEASRDGPMKRAFSLQARTKSLPPPPMPRAKSPLRWLLLGVRTGSCSGMNKERSQPVGTHGSVCVVARAVPRAVQRAERFSQSSRSCPRVTGHQGGRVAVAGDPDSLQARWMLDGRIHVLQRWQLLPDPGNVLGDPARWLGSGRSSPRYLSGSVSCVAEEVEVCRSLWCRRNLFYYPAR